MVICSVNMAGLAVDEILEREGMETITQFIREYPIVGVPVILLQMIAVIALAFHLWGCPPQPPP